MEKKIAVGYDFQGHCVKNVADPVDYCDVVNKRYVDNMGGTSRYTHYQSIASDVWDISHGLNILYPNIIVIDSAGDEVLGGKVTPVDENRLTVSFTSVFGGIAYIK